MHHPVAIQIIRGGHKQLFLSPQSQFRNLKKALLQSQFRNFLRNVALQPQLRNRNFLEVPTLNPQPESFTSAIFGLFFGREIRSIHEKKSEVKISCNCFKASFCFPEKQTVLKLFLIDF
jgi:hypothetical protein